MAEERQCISPHQELNPSRPTYCDSPKPLSNRFLSITRRKRYMTRRISPPATNFLAYRSVVLRFFKLNIKARHQIREFLNANLRSIHLIAFDIDWSWNIFTSHNFCSMFIEQLIDLEKVRTDNLKFRTDLGDRVMGDITGFFPRIDRIFPGDALNPFFGAQDEGFLEFRSR